MENLETTQGEKAVYETSFLVLPSLPEDKLPEVLDSIRKVITKAGGVELDSESPFKHPLSYPMSKNVGATKYVVNEAYIGWMKFEAEPSVALEIKSGLEKIAEVLRFLIVKAPRKTEFTFAKAKAAAEARREKERRAEEGEEEPVVNEDLGVSTESTVVQEVVE